MSDSAAVHSIDALKEFRVSLALYGDDTLAALGAVDGEVRRTLLWLQEDRPRYWQEQIKRRRDHVAEAKAEMFRRKLARMPDYSPSLAEPMENLRRAEAGLQDAEKRLELSRKWQPRLQQAALEYQASTRRLKDIAAGEIPRAVGLLARIIDALEAYLSVAPPRPDAAAAHAESSITLAPVEFETIAVEMLDKEPTPKPADAPAHEVCGEDELAASGP
jgi:hypothetical protein